MLTEGKQRISGLQRKWIFFSFLQVFLYSLGIAISITALLNRLLLWPEWTVLPAFIVLLITWILISPFWKISALDISRYLDSRLPQLEESTVLLLQPEGSLNVLQRLQVQKINSLLPQISLPDEPLKKKLKSGFLLLLISVAAFWLIGNMPLPSAATDGTKALVKSNSKIKESLPAQLSAVSVSIIPPAYTGKAARKQDQFSMKAEAGASIKWTISTNNEVKNLRFIFNGKNGVALKPANADSTVWTFSRKVDRPGFYQAVLNDKPSDLYRIEIIPDQPASIKIIQPGQNSTIDFGQPQKVDLKVLFTDDYGIRDSWITATMASGQGESVTFKEQKISFNSSFNGKTTSRQNKTLNLQALGMKPGDELYFYIKAFDNKGQESRTDVYFVSIQDTTELMSMAGMMGGVNLVPEYFRSQRQIIIDTEKLLKDQGKIPAEQFKNRANNLGIDQKLLRLRYGKFLGEESETEIGAGHDHESEERENEKDHNKEGHQEENPDHAEHQEAEKFGDIQSIMDQYAHNHDIAEDATFFEPEVKAQLKATLTEMWKAELRLRTYKPQEALPFEYKALRLLKDLQQKSRAYVSKTSVKPTPLKPEKRLTGELDKISNPVRKSETGQKPVKDKDLKKALAVLGNYKTGAVLKGAERLTLNQANTYLTPAAAANPSVYLSALQAMQKITTSAKSKVQQTDIAVLQKGLSMLITDKQPLPQAGQGLPPSVLSGFYFKNLNRSNP